jgi:tripartite-type tricarboxylate transporter receptor subunit TctC
MKENGTQVKFALASGIGSLTHLMTIVFETSVDVRVDIIPYRGAPPALTDILAGHVDVTWAPPELAVEQIRSGAAKGPAITSSERLATIPFVPSVVEMGYDNLAIQFWQGLFCPSRTPDAIIGRLNEALQIALADPKVHRQIEDIGTTIYPEEEQTPEAATALLNSEIKRWGDIIRVNKIELSP